MLPLSCTKRFMLAPSLWRIQTRSLHTYREKLVSGSFMLSLPLTNIQPKVNSLLIVGLNFPMYRTEALK